MWIVLGAVVLVAAFVGLWAWQRHHTSAIPEGIATGNGRLEAIQVDVASKFAGRVAEVLVKEGDRVEAGQVLAHMDTASLLAQLNEANARVANATSNKNTAAATVAQRQSALPTAHAVVTQRQSDLTLAQVQLDNSVKLRASGTIPQQQLDIDQNKFDVATAALTAAKAQVEEARTAIDVARAQVANSGTEIQEALATAERVKSDLAEAELKAPRAGRVQHRLVQAGEVVGDGAKILVIVDLLDVYMTVFLPEDSAGRLAMGSEARVVVDALPGYVFPATVSYVASEAQFTPKTIETASERQKLVFEVRLQLDPQVLAKYAALVKVGLPGLGYVRVNGGTKWPENLSVKLPPAIRAQP